MLVLGIPDLHTQAISPPIQIALDEIAAIGTEPCVQLTRLLFMNEPLPGLA